MKNIAILGASGYIGRSIISELTSIDGSTVYLFSRSKEKLVSFVEGLSIVDGKTQILEYDDFIKYSYDLVINCTGIGNPSILKKEPHAIFEVTEYFDNLIIQYLKSNLETTYINLSSGAVYGINNTEPVSEETKFQLNINNISSADYYSIAKINSEAKHRSLKDLNIVDLRVFSFFSRFVDINVGFLLSDIVKDLKNNQVFQTSSTDITRDFITPIDLVQAIKCVANQKVINDYFDVYSLTHVTKFEVLKYFKEKFGLKYEIVENNQVISPTGNKNEYFTKNKKLGSLGYVPRYSSLSGIEEEMQYIEMRN